MSCIDTAADTMPGMKAPMEILSLAIIWQLIIMRMRARYVKPLSAILLNNGPPWL